MVAYLIGLVVVLYGLVNGYFAYQRVTDPSVPGRERGNAGVSIAVSAVAVAIGVALLVAASR